MGDYGAFWVISTTSETQKKGLEYVKGVQGIVALKSSMIG